MAGFFLQHRPRRLPVLFLLDTSEQMQGTFQVTMQDGLQVVKSQLQQHIAESQNIYLGGVTFGEQAITHRLVPLDIFEPPTWQAQGACHLKPALLSLTETLLFDLIAARPGHPGDYSPLVFFILGNTPGDVWQERLTELRAVTDNRRPLIIVLVTRPELVNSMRAISEHVLLLKSAEAAYMTYFFFWVARSIAKIYEDSEHGTTAIDFPELPYGVVIPR